MTLTNSSDSETDENWEEISSGSSDEIADVSPTMNSHNDFPKNNKRPWNQSDLKSISLQNPIQKEKTKEDSFMMFEKEEDAVNHLKKMRNSENSDLNNEKNTKTIFEMVGQRYNQIAHDTNKPIIIEFDSLLVTILQSPIAHNYINGQPQTLPIIFAFEKFLKILSSGNRKLEIHSFESFESSWTNSIQKLTRRVVLHHLVKHLDPLPNFNVRRFQNFHEEEWSHTIELIAPSCTLILGNERRNELVGSDHLWHQLRRFGIHLFANELDCVRIEELFFVSNAIFGFVFMPSLGTIWELKKWEQNQPDAENKSRKSTRIVEKEITKKSFTVPLERVLEIVSGEEAYLVPILFALTNLLAEETEKNGENDITMTSRNLILSEILKKRLSLVNRSSLSPLYNLDEKENQLFDRLFVILFDNSDILFSDEIDCCDLIDVRLYCAVKQRNGIEVYEGEEAKLDEIWTKISEINEIKGKIDKLRINECGETLNKEIGRNTKGIETFPLHKMNGETASKLDFVSEFLQKFDLISEMTNSIDSDDSPSNSQSLFICDDLEEAMKEILTIKTNEDDRFAMINKTKFYAFMMKYCKSLASPKIVLRDVMVENTTDQLSNQPKKGKSSAKGSKKGAKKGSKKGKNTRKEEIIIQNQLRKKQKERDNLLIFIEQALKLVPLEEKIEKLDNKLLPIKDPIIALPGQLQLLEWLKLNYKNSHPQEDMRPATLLFRNVFDIMRRFHQSISVDQLDKLQKALLMMGFKNVNNKLVDSFNSSRGRQLATTIQYSNEVYCEPVGMNSVRFQLQHTGHFMVRSIKSQEDKRVSDFFPDDWQRLFLDAVDREESCLVVTPTSSGKTFISYYTMKKILETNKATERRSERGVVIFVCPSKALVNQVSADIYARYGEIFGVYTQDYSHSVLECQVLITVPDCIEKILLSPPFESFVKRIRYVIMDEVHSIGDALGGEIWERVILLLHCPFIALSATLGNPGTFHKWLESVSAALENTPGPSRPKVNLIEFYERWSDLEKYVYVPNSVANPTLSLKKIEPDYRSGESCLIPLNPLAVYKLTFCDEANFVLPELDLTSKDCLQLHDAIKSISEGETEEIQKEIERLKPETYFQSLCITKNEVTLYGKELKKLLRKWHEDGNWKIIERVLENLTAELKPKISKMERGEKSEEMIESAAKKETKPDGAEKTSNLTALPNVLNKNFDGPYSEDFMVRHLVPLLIELRNNKDLPALVFVKSQHACDSLLQETLRYLEDNEKQVESRGDMKDRLRRKKQELKDIKAWKRMRDRIDKRKEEEMLKEGTIPVLSVDDEDDIDFRFSFIGPGESADEDEISYWMKRTLRRNNWTKGHPFLRSISRGIAVHHNSMTRAYRTLVEVMFRAKHIKVVLTVGTLALGVNMPCRTTVFAGDSPDLTPLRYRQMMGRAGRRGYDNIGKVIFFAVPPQKIAYLMTSTLLSLHGHGSLTMSTFLRNLFCIASSENKAFRIRNFCNMMKDSFGHESIHKGDKNNISPQMKLLFRYSMEYLLQNRLVDRNLAPNGMAGIVAKLYPQEPSNFVFAALFAEGIFNKICSPLNKYTSSNSTKTSERIENEQVDCCRLLEILAHVFVRIPVPTGFKRTPYFNSKLVLDPAPENVQKVLMRFNATTVALFTQFLRLSQLQKGEQKQEKLPLTRRVVGGNTEGESLEAETTARSGFASITGQDDRFESGQDIRHTGRQYHLLFDKSDSVPVLETKDAMGNDLLLNSYAVDFFKHGSLPQLIKENNLDELFAWNQLKEWSLTLKSIDLVMDHLVKRGEKGDSLHENAVVCRYAFSTLRELFDESFNKISEIVMYK